QTAPGVVFDIQPAQDAWGGDFGNSMFLFGHHYNNEQRTFKMSDMKILATELCVEYVDPRRSYTLNVLGGIMVANMDGVEDWFAGGTWQEIALDATVENIHLEGTQNLPGVRGFWYGRPYEWENNIFGGIEMWVFASGALALKNCHIVNADVGANTSEDTGIVVSANTFEKGFIGLEVRGGDSQVISDNQFYNNRTGLYMDSGTDGFRIENNTFACPLDRTDPAPDSYYRYYEYGINLGWDCPNTTIVGNQVLGTSQTTIYRYGIEATYAPNTIMSGNDVTAYRHALVLDRWNPDSIISNNTASILPSNATGHAIYVARSGYTNVVGNTVSGTALSGLLLYRSSNCIATQNTFSGLDALDAVVFVDRGVGVDDQAGNHSIMGNDYTQVGSTGFGCVALWASNDNYVFESGNFPPGTGGATNNILDYGTNNRVVGHPANHVSDPGIGQQLQQISAELDAMEEELIAAEAEQEESAYPW
ncbi:MAG: NosD domain-containing protein, partial [Planctomycetota bacterium]